MTFIIQSVLPVLDKEYLNFDLKDSTYSVTIKDMNIFSEKKTNLGLFNLKDDLNLRFYLNSTNPLAVKLYLNNMKLYFLK